MEGTTKGTSLNVSILCDYGEGYGDNDGGGSLLASSKRSNFVGGLTSMVRFACRFPEHFVFL